MQAHMVSFFKEQIFVFHAISELFPSEITSSNLMQNMSGCHCRDLVKLRELAGSTNLQKQCSFAQDNVSRVHVHSLGISRQQVWGALPLGWEPGHDSGSEAGTLVTQTQVRGSQGFLTSRYVLCCPCAWAHMAYLGSVSPTGAVTGTTQDPIANLNSAHSWLASAASPAKQGNSDTLCS